jgi:hypothetical protein
MVEWVEKYMNISKTKAYFLISLVNLFPVRQGGIKKIKNLELAMPIIKIHPESKDEIFERSQDMGRKDFLLYLKSYKTKKSESLPMPKTGNWYTSQEELFQNSFFLRRGVSAKTQLKMMRELVNLRLLAEPENKEWHKIRSLLSKFKG